MSDRDEKQVKKDPNPLKIKGWFGTRKTGHWVRESVVTGVKRVVKRIASDPDHGGKRKNLREVTEEELVYNHSGYRPKLEGEKDTRKAFFFRGARVWRD